MGKEVKTNAMRILDKNKIPYEIINYECDEFIDGLHDSARNFDKIYISGGRIGTSITVNPDALLSVVRGQYADIIMH